MEVFSGSLNGKLLWEAWIGTSSSIVEKHFYKTGLFTGGVDLDSLFINFFY